MGKYLNSLHTISFTLKKSTYTQSGIFFQLPQNIAPEVRTKYKATVLFCQTFMKCVLLCLHFGKNPNNSNFIVSCRNGLKVWWCIYTIISTKNTSVILLILLQYLSNWILIMILQSVFKKHTEIEYYLVLLFLLVNALNLCLVTRYWCGKFNGRNDPSKSGFSVLNQVPNQYIYCSKMLETYRFYNCIFGFWFFWKCFVHIWYNMITSKKRDENHQYPKWYQDQSENGYLSILILIVFPACLIKSLQTSWFMSNTWVPLISTMKSLSFSPVSYAIVLKMIWQKKR